MESLWELLRGQFADNQFFSGGLILMLSGAALAAARHIPGRVWGWIKHRCLTEIDIPDREPAFEWLDTWLAVHAYSQQRARRLTVRVQQADHSQRVAEPGGDHRPRILFSPAPGEHWLWYCGRLVILNRQRADTETNSQGKAPLAIRETFTITIVSRNRRLAWKLLEEAREHVLPRGEQRLTIYNTSYCSWNEQTKRLPRPPESVVLAEGMMDDLLADVQRFLGGRAWYVQRGIPYRRGYLLHGPPGTGKSSAVVAVASALGMDIAVLSLNSTGLDDNELLARLADVPTNAIVLIEDIDCAFVARKGGDDKANRVTFSGLLNALDGVAAGEGRILFATTNHPKRLDPALVRPGRIDRKFYLGLADSEQLRRIFVRFFPAAAEEMADRFVAAIPAGQIAMSAIQTHLIRHANSAEAAVECADELFAELETVSGEHSSEEGVACDEQEPWAEAQI